MAHPGKIGAHHALMGITMVVFAIGAGTFGPQLMTSAASENANAKQRDAFVVVCKDKYVEKLTSALAAATSQPGVRRALEGYWKEVNQCVVRETKNSRTGSGTDMKKDKKQKPGSGSVVSEEMRKKIEAQKEKESKTSPKPAAPSEDGTEFKPKEEFKFRNSATPKPGETPKPRPTHNGEDEI